MKSPFLTMVSEFMYKKRYAKRTIESYLKWIADYIRFHQMRHPATLHNPEVECFLNYLVLQHKVAANTQKSALNALNFLYKDVLENPLSSELNFARSSKQQKLPEVLTQKEITRFFQCCNLTHQFIICKWSAFNGSCPITS